MGSLAAWDVGQVSLPVTSRSSTWILSRGLAAFQTRQGANRALFIIYAASLQFIGSKEYILGPMGRTASSKRTVAVTTDAQLPQAKRAPRPGQLPPQFQRGSRRAKDNELSGDEACDSQTQADQGVEGGSWATRKALENERWETLRHLNTQTYTSNFPALQQYSAARKALLLEEIQQRARDAAAACTDCTHCGGRSCVETKRYREVVYTFFTFTDYVKVPVLACTGCGKDAPPLHPFSVGCAATAPISSDKWVDLDVVEQYRYLTLTAGTSADGECAWPSPRSLPGR